MLLMRRVVVVAFEGVQSLDISGPVEVLARAGELAGSPYAISVVTSAGTPVVASPSGLRLMADAAIAEIKAPLDTLIIAGGDGTADALTDHRLVAGIRRLARRARRVASVCTGSFLLAEAGVLSGRRATTHWGSLDALATRYPDVIVERDPIFVRDGHIWTSAGVTAGMDLALALVEDDHGADVALQTARRLVMYVRRPGGQSQFSAALQAQAADTAPLREVQAYIAEHLHEDLAVDRLAQCAAMSTRNFSRAFAREVGVTPARYVESLRVEAARRLLHSTGRPVEDIASACGFGTPETMRRTFMRRVGVPPAEYRKRFQKETA